MIGTHPVCLHFKELTDKNMNDETVMPAQDIRNMMAQMVFTRSLSIAAELGIADHVADEPKTMENLATLCKTHQNSLYRLIRVLSSQGVFHVNANGRISNSNVSEYLRTEIPGSQRNFARMMGSQWMWKTFNHLEHSVNTGDSAFVEAFPGSQNLYQYFRETGQQEGKIFSQAMSGFSYSFDPVLVDVYDFSGFTNIVDVGGAEGRLLKLIKQKNSSPNTILFELSHVIEQARTAAAADLLQFVAGDFFKRVEPSADCIILKYILHNWDDEHCITILNNCRESLLENGKLLIMDILIKEQEKQTFEKSLDIIMLLLLGAKERTEEEFADVLSKSRLAINRIIPTSCPLSIIEVIPVDEQRQLVSSV